MKRVAILGSTGSIGTQTLDIIEQFPDDLKVVALASGTNEALLAQQAAKWGVSHTAVFARDGIDAICNLATLEEVDTVVVSVAGVIGLKPTLAAIEAGKAIALASKEVLVSAGEVVMPMVKRLGTLLTPIDSEHSALFQCLQGYRPDQVEDLILTASGGPFRGWSLDQLGSITVEQALNHPTWRMGGKITIDSSTLMNKGLEVIEAKWLFDVDIDHVKVVVHPQSVVHSMVRFRDGSVLGQLGWPNMRLPIAYALLYPERSPNRLPAWNPTDTPNLTFEPVDEQTFRCLGLAREAAKIGGTMPCAMNAANEEAANAFLRGEIGFLDIPRVVEGTMLQHQAEFPSLDHLLAVDSSSRAIAKKLMATNQ